MKILKRTSSSTVYLSIVRTGVCVAVAKVALPSRHATQSEEGVDYNIWIFSAANLHVSRPPRACSYLYRLYLHLHLRLRLSARVLTYLVVFFFFFPFISHLTYMNYYYMRIKQFIMKELNLWRILITFKINDIDDKACRNHHFEFLWSLWLYMNGWNFIYYFVSIK